MPYWDLVFGDGSEAPRDSSAAAIAVCGLLELAALERDRRAPSTRTRPRPAHPRSLVATTRRHPRTPTRCSLHGVYDLPKGIGVDEGNLWGDYFYLEALTRSARPGWKPYW